ncbi:hypothetical protein QVD17_08017 [Tagetes erecta]|uniref:Uncharacterized protein n=1 Tax=Tagetes erecta TaxID=13708 RepID=A0AAD8KYK2_TARER|nr:hypothetical protein QVD17_08017 [Tagetes erecta]
MTETVNDIRTQRSKLQFTLTNITYPATKKYLLRTNCGSFSIVLSSSLRHQIRHYGICFTNLYTRRNTELVIVVVGIWL